MSTAIKAHGLDGSMVEPDWPPLTLDEMRTLLARFIECGEAREILTVSPRPFSAACVVATDAGKRFIKRHHRSVRDREGLLEEHRFMQHLLAHDVKTPRVFADRSGETAIEIGEWTYEVHDVPHGVDVYSDALSWTPFRTAAHAESAGRALACLHLAAHGFNAPRRKPRPLVASFAIFAGSDPALAMEGFLDARPALRQHPIVRAHAKEALDLLAPFHAELRPLLPALEPLWTHNDLHGSNLLWSDESDRAQASAIIDFGLCDRTNAVHDLAIAIDRSIVEWLVLVDDPARPERVPVHVDHLRALLAGYESVRPLSDDEAAALAPMTALCHAEFALSEADYFLGVLHSEESAAMAHDGWLAGHARWFRSPAGPRLPDFLRSWSRARHLRRNESE